MFQCLVVVASRLESHETKTVACGEGDVGWFLCLKRRDVWLGLPRSALSLRLPDVVAQELLVGDAWMVWKVESLRVLSGIAAQQIVGRERRERAS
jgi:hypothetical protein